MSRRVTFLIIKLAIAAVAIAFLVSTRKLQLSQLRIAADGWHWLAVAGALVLAAILIIQARLWLLLNAGEVSLTASRVIGIGLASWFFNASLLGGLGFFSSDAIRTGFLMREARSRYAVIVVSIVLDRLVGLAALLTFCAISLLVAQRAGLPTSTLGLLPIVVYLATALCSVGMIVLAIARLYGAVPAAIVSVAVCIAAAVCGETDVAGLAEHNIPTAFVVLLVFAVAAPAAFGGPALARLAAKTRLGGALDAVAAFRRRPAILFAGYAGSLASQGLLIFALFATGRAITIDASPTFAQTLFAAPIAFITTILPLPANGLGVGEIAFDSMLRVLGTAGAAPLIGGAAVYLSYRVLSTIMALVGLPFFLALRRAATQSDGR